MNQLARRAVLLVADGCRPGDLERAAAPSVASLIENGAYTNAARTVFPCQSLPAHASLLWGVEPDLHGLTANRWPADFVHPVPTLFDVCKEAGLRTAMVHAWKPLTPLARPGTVDHLLVDDAFFDDLNAGRAVARLIADRGPELVFCHMNNIDEVGETHGWGSDQQQQAIELMDEAVGHILQELRRSGAAAETALFLLADHGGNGLSHEEEIPENLIVPWLAAGAGIRRGHRIAAPVRIHDTPATIARVLGIEPPAAWTGRVVEEAFE